MLFHLAAASVRSTDGGILFCPDLRLDALQVQRPGSDGTGASIQQTPAAAGDRPEKQAAFPGPLAQQVNTFIGSPPRSIPRS